MSIKLTLDPKRNAAGQTRSWYTGGDKLSGKVTLNLSKETTVSAVTVSIYGVSYTQLQKKVDGTAIAGGGGLVDSETEFNIVLDELKQLFPSDGLDLNTAYTLQQGTHTFPFDVVLPLYAMPQGSVGSKARQAQILPPSISDQGEQMVQYFIKAKVRYTGNWGASTNTSEQFFTFLPSDDVHEELEPTIVRAKGILEKPWWNIVGSAAKSCNSHRWEFKSKPTATPRVPCDLELWVTFLAQESIEIQSVGLKLEAITHAKARNLKETYTYTTCLFKSKSLVKVAAPECKSKHAIKVPLDFAELMIPDKIAPGFTTPNIRREYQLVCFIKYQHQKAVTPKHSVELRLPIQVMSGIKTPNWETGFVEEVDRDFPMNGLYYSHRDRGVAIV